MLLEDPSQLARNLNIVGQTLKRSVCDKPDIVDSQLVRAPSFTSTLIPLKIPIQNSGFKM